MKIVGDIGHLTRTPCNADNRYQHMDKMDK